MLCCTTSSFNQTGLLKGNNICTISKEFNLTSLKDLFSATKVRYSRVIVIGFLSNSSSFFRKIAKVKASPRDSSKEGKIWNWLLNLIIRYLGLFTFTITFSYFFTCPSRFYQQLSQCCNFGLLSKLTETCIPLDLIPIPKIYLKPLKHSFILPSIYPLVETYICIEDTVKQRDCSNYSVYNWKMRLLKCSKEMNPIVLLQIVVPCLLCQRLCWIPC